MRRFVLWIFVVAGCGNPEAACGEFVDAAINCVESATGDPDFAASEGELFAEDCINENLRTGFDRLDAVQRFRCMEDTFALAVCDETTDLKSLYSEVWSCDDSG